MTVNPRHSNDAIEDALFELHEAELAGVFQLTSIPRKASQTLGRRTSEFRPASSWASRGVLLGLAASLLMAIGVWTTMFGYQISRLRQQAARPIGEVVASSFNARSEIGRFGECLAGPGGSKNGGCSSFDYDRNGRVDLHDFGARQRATLLASN